MSDSEEQIEDKVNIEFKRNLERALDFMEARIYCEAEKILLDLLKSDYQTGMVQFILGRLYAEQGLYEKAMSYLHEALKNYQILEDYVLKLIVDVHIMAGDLDNAIERSKQIDNPILLRYAREAEITSLLALQRDKEAASQLASYVKQYPGDRDYSMTLAALLNSFGELNEPIGIYKDVYLDAVPRSEDALNELKVLEADTFSTEEKLKRAANLYEAYSYLSAESAFKEVLTQLDDEQKNEVMFSISMCQFRTKRYEAAADSFGFLKSPKWLYWRARSYYRIDHREGFNRVKNEFDKLFPSHKRLALLFIMEADELKRQGDIKGASRSYLTVLERFPASAEDALWGLGWLNYSSEKYDVALRYFSELETFENSKDYLKYLYWKARAQEKLAENCRGSSGQALAENAEICSSEGNNYYDDLPSDESYYGYLIKSRSSVAEQQNIKNDSNLARSAIDNYKRIEDLVFLGMRAEAADEIIYHLKKTSIPDELLFLGSLALELGKYREVVTFAEPRREKEFLPYSYPRVYWDAIERSAELEEIDKYLIAALIREESRYDPKVVSWAGAIGLMQLMPSTAERMNKSVMIHFKDSTDLQNIRTNISLGSHYLSNLIREFREVPFAVAAYNAGENALKRWQEKYFRNDVAEFIENIPYKETRQYVKKVLKSYWQYQTIYGHPLSGFGHKSSEDGSDSSIISDKEIEKKPQAVEKL